MFKFWRSRKRRRLATQPLPSSWLPIIDRRLPWLTSLKDEEKQRALEHLKVFFWEKFWIGAREFEVTDEMKIVISGQAARLSRNIGLDVYDRLSEIIVYPTHYVHPDRDAIVYGEAHTWGTVVLSWDAVRNGLSSPTDGRDTSLHEFAHVLDIADGWFDGTPILHHTRDYPRWGKALGKYYTDLLEDPSNGVVREYGAINEAEFFAVSTEAFFEHPKTLRRKAPELYNVLARFYKTDEARR